MTFSFEKKLILSFAILLTGMVAAGIATFKNNQSTEETDYWVEHTREVLYEAEQVFSLMQDIVLSSRGYVITGDTAFLKPFTDARYIIHEHIHSLEKLVNDNSVQRERTDSLKKYIDWRIEFSILTIQTRREKGFEEAQQLIASGKGKFYMDEIRNTIQAIQQEENKLLSERQAAHKKATAAYNRSFYLLLGSVMVLLMLVLFTVRHNLRVRKKAEEQLKESEEKYALLFNSIDEGFCIIEMILDEQKKPVDYRFLAVNASFEKQTGLLNAVGKRMREFAPNHEEYWFEIYGKIALTGESARFENRAEQLHRWYDVYAFRFGDPKNLQVAILFNDITERKEAAEELFIKNEWYNQTLISLGDGVIATDVNGVITLMNKAACELTGWTQEEAVGSHVDMVFEISNERTGLKVINPLMEALQENKIVWLANHTILKRKDGSILFIDDSGAPIHNQKKEIIGGVLIFRDITEKKKAENELFKLKKELELIFNSVQDGIHGINKDGIIIFENPAAVHMLGWEQKDLIGKPAHATIHHTYPNGVLYPVSECSIYATLKDGVVRNVENESFWRKDGTSFPISYTSSPMRNEANEIIGTIVTFRDITEKKKAEEQLKEYQHFFNNSNDLCLIANFQGYVETVNRNYEKTLGYSEEELKVKPFIEIVHPEDLDRTLMEVENLNAGMPSINYTNRNLKKNGEYLWIEWNVTPNPVTGKLYGVGRDITERRRAEEQIKKMNAELEQKVEERTRLYHFISQINTMIVRVKDEETLFRDTCRIAVDTGKLKLAWIGMTDENGILKRRTLAGDESVAKKILKTSLNPDDPALQNIPTVKVLKTGRYECNNDVQNDPLLITWRDEFALHGIHSSISLPIFKFGKIVGVLGIFGGEKDFFDESEIALLEEVAGDISFALENLEKEEQRRKNLLAHLKLEANLQTSQARLKGILDAEPECVKLMDANYKLLEMNPSGLALIDADNFEQVAGRSMLNLVKEKYRRQFQKFTADVFKGISGILEFEITSLKGTERWMETHAVPMKNEAGEIISLLGVSRDITERKKAENKLIEQFKELQKVNSELDRFVYSTSHDLRAPLKSMLGLINITKGDTESGNTVQHKRLEMLKKSVIRLDDFIEEILDYSRNTRLEVAKDEIIFEELIQEIRANHKFMEETKGLKLQVEIDQKERFVSDKRRLKVVLNNLISNAIKYSDASKDKSFVKIYVQCRRENAIVAVEDNGVGIAETDREKIFEMFYRASALSSGSGLGLYIVKETMEKLGGAIHLESELNKGTKFSVTIPNQIIA